MKDFFISYTGTDKKWAEWIAWQLENAGYSTVIQAWDFRPGQNFVLEMHKAAKDTQRTIAVLSQSWLNALYTQPEWAAAFTQDPTGDKQKLILIRIDNCKPEGLLSAIIYIDLVGLSETDATNALLEGIKRERNKPETKPSFPITIQQPVSLSKPRFPGALPSVWNISSPRNLNFTGREDILKDLRKSLTSEKSATLTQAIHGLGGVGKTQLALEYAYRYTFEYDKVWWIRAEDTTTLAEDYSQFASAIGLPVKDIPEQSAIIREAKQWLGQNGNWLLIFDNAQRPEDIRYYLPQGRTGHVLITSRYQVWSGIARPLKVNVMDPSESVEFLYRRTGQEDKETAKLLAEELGHLPLALEQAGAYIESAKKSLNDYLKLYREYTHRILERGKPSTDYPATVATTWEISFQKTRERSSSAIDLLNICAFLSPDEIPRELLFEGIKGTSDSLVASLTDLMTFDEAISILNTYSLIKARSDTLAVHRLIQAVTRDRLKREEQETWFKVAVKIINDIFPSKSDDVRFWKKCAVLLPHAQVLISCFDKYATVAIIEFGCLLNQVGLYLRSRAEYSNAEPLFRCALEICEKQLGQAHPHLAASLNNLALLFHNQGKYAEAEPLCRRALGIWEKQLGQDHPDVALSLNNLAGLLQDQGKYADAEPLFRRALEIREKQLGQDHPNVALSLNNLALLFHNQGKYADAKPPCRRA
ncbi:MAG: FxSxx-COOH system tetratricopeptide repeat protein, partial [Candidatus Brocadiales bacterium]|nr:FxSxx-COOH system tetratricopeptide repeat protein [Candidatus Brocadiales bacterium]